MVKFSQPWRNPRFCEYDRHVERLGRMVTGMPVYFALVDGIPRGGTTESTRYGDAAASLVRYNRPREYQVVIKRSFFYHNQFRPAIRKIIAHEVAHVRHNDHGPRWRALALRLGADEYATARGRVK